MKISETKNLRELRDTLNSHDEPCEEFADEQGLCAVHDVARSELPTFGGTEPKNTSGVWSWDESNFLLHNGTSFVLEARENCAWTSK